MKCGLLGRKLGHSYSPLIHSHLGSYSYGLFQVEPEALEDFIRHGDWDAINVTMPYKKAVMPFLDRIDPSAEKLGCVNTLVRRDGLLWGFNTDYDGFHSTVSRSGLKPGGKKALVLGSGGASATVQAVMRELGAEVTVISRSGADNYANLERHSDAAILINTTPVGMYPNAGVSPVELDRFPALEGVLDVVYNPARTRLLLDAEGRGIVAMNGLWMLVAQAKRASEHFTGCSIDDAAIEQIHSLLQRQTENIILVGMPGCGKSTLGPLLAARTGKVFVDTDEKIAEAAGMSVPEIFAAEGEAGFRRRETQALQTFGQESGLVIATGGGCVTQAENLPALRQNGRILWVQRSIGSLPTDGRPLSRKGNLEQMYRARQPLYRQFADFCVNNDGSVEDTLAAMMEVLK